MKHLRIAPVFALLLLIGCARDSVSRIAQARASLTLAEKSTLTLHSSGFVSDKELVSMDATVKAARSTIEIAESTPDAQDMDAYLDLAEAMIEKLIQLQQEKSDGTRSTSSNYQIGAGHHRLCRATGRAWQAERHVYARAA